MRAAAVLLGSALLIVGCSREPDRTATDKDASPVGAATGVDTAYVDRTLAQTAFDFAQCRQSPAMQGLAGAAEFGDVLLAIDSSGSMAGHVGSGSKMAEARDAASRFVAGLPSGTQVGLLVFGDVGDNRPASKGASCSADPHLLYGPAPVDAAGVEAAVARMRPAGWTPLAAAIRRSAGRFTGDGARRTLFVVSDGMETCGGDPVAAARDARASARVVVNVIGYGIGQRSEADALRQVAEAGGGSYQDARPGDLFATLRGQAVKAQSNNSVSVAKAETGMQDCYLTGIAKARDALMTRIDADRAAGRIDQATHAALVDASMERFQASYDDFVKTHKANMGREKAASSQMDTVIGNNR